MALIRPPDVACGSFAALGPQLQTLARAVDSEMCGMSSAAILAGLDAPAYAGTHAGGVAVPGNGVDYAFMYFSTPVEYYNSDPTLGPIRHVILGNNPFIAPLTKRAWFYLGVWIQTNPSPLVTTRWKMRVQIPDTDPITGLVTSTTYYRHWRNSFAAAVGGNEHFHFDLLFPSGGGFINISLKQNSGGNISTVSGGMWLMRMSITR